MLGFSPHRLGVGLIAIAWSAPALAGDEPLYQSAADWVQVVPLADVVTETAAAELLVDNQYWFKDGTTFHYFDRVIRIDSPDMLTNQGTLQAAWLPDKGDLVVNRLAILRGDETIDLIAQGARFEVLRRERNLEQRLLDGQLTATLAVPGLRMGDILRVSYTVSNKDQALGEEVQALQYLIPEPYQVGQARVLASWPQEYDMTWEAGPDVEGVEETSANGVTTLSIDLPIARRQEVPYDAPSRYQRPPLLTIGSFADWQDLSRVMEPHFTKAAVIDDDSDLSDKVAAIMAQTTDPMERTLLATRMVQDQVSYLLDGLDGGNYLPQSAEETWANLYGDCKAKSVLLHAMLMEMGIQSQVVLVTTAGGDRLSEVMALPGHFNHMIVRANVAGEDLWIDGTSTGTRANNIRTVPPFHYALPLTATGSDLVPMSQRVPQQPEQTITTRMDYSAGFDLPGLARFEMQMSGPNGAMMQQMANRMDEDMRQQMLRQQGGGASGIMTDLSIAYDEETATGTWTATGVAPSAFVYDDGELSLPMKNGAGMSFAPDRARSAWRDIPVATSGPSRIRNVSIVTLPGGGAGVTFEGEAAYTAEVANVSIDRTTKIEGAALTDTVEVTQMLGEIAPDRFSQERRAALALASREARVVAPADMEWRWEVEPAELERRIAPLRAQFDLAVAQAEDDDFGPLMARAMFNELVMDYSAAIDDLNAIIAEEASAAAISTRAQLHFLEGNYVAALVDAEMGFDLDPSVGPAAFATRILSQQGRTDEALALLDLVPASGEELLTLTEARAHVLAKAGQREEGFALIADYLADNEATGAVRNTDCWYRAVFEVALDDALAQCTSAVEQSNQPANALDSRAMLYFKMGNDEAALTDLDAALRLSPDLGASLYLRGIVLLRMGDERGQEDIQSALRLGPSIADQYAAYGIEPVR